jgi:hypothetical protein
MRAMEMGLLGRWQTSRWPARCRETREASVGDEHAFDRVPPSFFPALAFDSSVQERAYLRFLESHEPFEEASVPSLIAPWRQAR